MNVVKRFASTSTSSVPTLGAYAIPSAPYLPPVLERHVQRHLLASPSSSVIPNPFSGPARSISRRREKQLRASVYDDTLPSLPSLGASGAETATGSGAGRVRILSPDGTEKDIPWAAAELGFKARAKATKIAQLGGEVKYTTGIHRGKQELKFKGHKHEREKPERERETRERLEGMAKRIAEWKKVCACS
jgi:hypothetical protein